MADQLLPAAGGGAFIDRHAFSFPRPFGPGEYWSLLRSPRIRGGGGRGCHAARAVR